MILIYKQLLEIDKNKFGKPDKTIFVMGDYDKGSYNMKGLEPVICKKFRKIFRKLDIKHI
jgi:hypothetical protein